MLDPFTLVGLAAGGLGLVVVGLAIRDAFDRRAVDQLLARVARTSPPARAAAASPSLVPTGPAAASPSFVATGPAPRRSAPPPVPVDAPRRPMGGAATGPTRAIGPVVRAPRGTAPLAGQRTAHTAFEDAATRVYPAGGGRPRVDDDHTLVDPPVERWT